MCELYFSAFVQQASAEYMLMNQAHQAVFHILLHYFYSDKNYNGWKESQCLVIIVDTVVVIINITILFCYFFFFKMHIVLIVYTLTSITLTVENYQFTNAVHTRETSMYLCTGRM